ncbi:MAG: cupin domain-containing protein [Actinomycetia bacterium]|nr:cupin domain-containing protein [Actinomycetes bacterium]
MKILRREQARKVAGEGYLKRILVPEESLGIPGSFIQEVSFRKGDVVRQHYHRTQTEVFIALDEAHFEIDGEKVIMTPGDVVICEPGDVHGNPVIPHDFRILVLKIDYRDDDTVWQ